MTAATAEGWVDPGNSTVETLAQGASFTGDWVACAGFGSIQVTSTGSQLAEFYAEFSMDRTQVDRTVPINDGDTLESGIHSLIPVTQWYRIRVVNVYAGTNDIRLQSTVHKGARVAQPTSRVAQMVGPFTDVLNTRVLGQFDLDVARGQYSNMSVVHKFGRNPDITTVEEDIIPQGGTYAGFIQSAVAVRVRAGGTSTDSAANTGARKIIVSGLDQDWNLAQEEITLAGASASSATTTTFIRVFRAYVSEAGTYHGNNDGTVIVETTGGVFMVQIAAGVGQSQAGHYSVPAGKTAYIRTFTARVDGNKNANVFFWQNQTADTVSAPYGAKRLVHAIPGLSGEARIEHGTWDPYPEKTGLWASAITLAGSSGVTVEFELILRDN